MGPLFRAWRTFSRAGYVFLQRIARVPKDADEPVSTRTPRRSTEVQVPWSGRMGITGQLGPEGGMRCMSTR